MNNNQRNKYTNYYINFGTQSIIIIIRFMIKSAALFLIPALFLNYILVTCTITHAHGIDFFSDFILSIDYFNIIDYLGPGHRFYDHVYFTIYSKRNTPHKLNLFKNKF